MSITAAQIAERINGEILGDGSVALTGFAQADSARPGDLTFAEKARYFAAAERSDASAIMVPPGFTSSRKVLIRVSNPRVAMARVLPLFFPPSDPPCGLDSGARIAGTATIDPTAFIGPGCVIGDRARVGARTVLLGGNHIGEDVAIGSDSWLYPSVVVYARCKIGNRVHIHAGTVIGADGYGYVLDEGRHRKILQVGTVVIHDDVEIGANATIDRGALGDTVIGEGTKISNLVAIGHNVVIGRHCLVLAQSGIAGSTRIGDYSLLAAQCGIAGHLKLGSQVMVGGKSGVLRDIPDGGRVFGMIAVPDMQAKRQVVAAQRLPDWIHRLRALEREVQELRKLVGASSRSEEPIQPVR